MGSNSSKPISPLSSPAAVVQQTDDEDSSPRSSTAKSATETTLQQKPPTPTTTGGCPMHNSANGTYSYNWWKVLTSDFITQHGPSGKQPLSQEDAESKTGRSNSNTNTKNASPPNNPLSTTTTTTTDATAATTTAGAGGCPVKHNPSSAIPLSPNLTTSGGGGGCPVRHQNLMHKDTSATTPAAQYNVYGQPIDPTNQMPYNPNQLPSYKQSISLSTHRVASTIPKGGSSEDSNPTTTNTWVYPSPQMFYNALQRKNKLGDESNTGVDKQSESTTASQEESSLSLRPQDIESVVAIHNNMNEKTWYKILQWEAIRNANNSSSSSSSTNAGAVIVEPKLLKFQGRPMDLSPKAALKYYLFGHPLPYDRHDWVIERTTYGGSSGQPPTTEQQRYVIDYYYDASLGRTDPESAMPDMNDRTTGSPSLLVDVRPALDSVSAVYHRMITMPYSQYTNTTTTNNSNEPRTERYEYLPLRPSSTMKSQVNESIQVWQDIRKNSYASGNGEDSNNEMNKKKQQQQETLNQTVKDELIHQFQQAIQSCQKQQLRMNQVCSNIDLEATDTEKNNSSSNNNKETLKLQQQCAKASIDVTLCMGSILCPIQHAAFRQTIQQQKGTNNSDNDDDDDGIIDEALTRVQDCLRYKSQQYQQINNNNNNNNNAGGGGADGK